jgi:hypothetical protein
MPPPAWNTRREPSGTSAAADDRQADRRHAHGTPAIETTHEDVHRPLGPLRVRERAPVGSGHRVHLEAGVDRDLA